jgi:cell division protease FtsH
MSKNELLNKIAVMLGGRAAESIVFEDVSTGAHNDLSKATQIARSMVTEYGMGEQLGHMYLERERRKQMPDMEFNWGNNYSEQTAQLIDTEVKGILDKEFKVAREILTKYRTVMEKGAELVLKEEQIEGDRLKALLEADGATAT